VILFSVIITNSGGSFQLDFINGTLHVLSKENNYF